MGRLCYVVGAETYRPLISDIITTDIQNGMCYYMILRYDVIDLVRKLGMYDNLTGTKAFVDIEGTQYHGEIVGTHISGEVTMYELDVPEFGVFNVERNKLQKEITND